MLHGRAAWGSLPWGYFIPGTDSKSIGDALPRLLANPTLPRSWWLRADPRDRSTSTTPPTLLNVNLSTDGHRTNERTLTYPDGTITVDDETLQLPEALVQPFSVAHRLNGLWGIADMVVGDIVIGDADGSRRNLADEDWIGRNAEIWLGPRDGIQLQFTRVAQLVTRNMHYDRSTLTLIADSYDFLFAEPVALNYYAGTAGLEGGNEIQGKPKPLLFGQVRQFEPVLVSGTSRIYQLHDGAMESVQTVDDKGNALAFNQDVADIEAADPSLGTGEFNTSLANGYIRLGDDPDGDVTCDAQGHNSSAAGYVETVSGLIKLLAVTFAGLVDPDEIDTAAFTTLTTHTDIMGHYVDNPAKIIDVIRVFLRSAAAWAWMKPDKLLTVGRVTDPDSATADISLDANNDDLRLTPWSVMPFEIPVGRVRIGYKPYPKTLANVEVDSFIALAERYDRGQPYRFAKAEDAPTFVQIPEALTVEILTNLDREVDAQALADEQLALRKVARWLGTFALTTGMITREVGDVIEITDDRLATSPKKWTVLGVRNSAESAGSSDEIVVECFG